MTEDFNYYWREYDNGNYHTMISLENGTKIRFTEDDEFYAEFAENIDLKLTDKCSGTNCAVCHEGSSPNGKEAPLERVLDLINTMHTHQEIALGGGNILEYSYLLDVLFALAQKDVIANITVHQTHLLENIETISMLKDFNFIYGIGVSVWNVTDELLEQIQHLDNVVLHTIVGVTPYSMYEKLMNKGLKVLLLGYKSIRRGEEYKLSHNDQIEKNTKELESNFDKLKKGFKVLSMDNLAIEQLHVKDKMTSSEWQHFYMGDEGQFTFFIDAVNGTYSKNSTAPMSERFSLKSTVDEMFRDIRNRG